MPILQLKTAPLANPKTSVRLDTARRPRVDTSAMSSALQQLGRSATAVLAPEELANNRGLQAIAKAVGAAGDAFQAVQLKKREAEDHILLAEADNKLNTAYAEHVKFRQENPDASTWEKDWQQRLDSTTKALYAGKKPATQEGQTRLQVLTTRFQGQSAINVATDAAKATFARAADVNKANASRKWQAKDYDGALAAMEEGVKAGYNSEAELAHLEGQKQNAIAADTKEASRNKVAAELARDPWATRQRLEDALAGKHKDFPGLDEADLLNLRSSADSAAEEMQRDGYQSINDAITAGTLDTAGIDAFAAKYKLGESTVAKLKADHAELAKMKASAAPLDVELFQQTNEAMKSYDPAKDPTGEQWAALDRRAMMVGTQGGEQGERLMSSLRQYFWQKAPGGKKEPDNKAVPTDLQRLLNETIAADETAKVWGETKAGEKPTRQLGEAEAAYNARVQAWQDAAKTAGENAQKLAMHRYETLQALEKEVQAKPEMTADDFSQFYFKRTGRKQSAAAVESLFQGAVPDLFPQGGAMEAAPLAPTTGRMEVPEELLNSLLNK